MSKPEGMSDKAWRKLHVRVAEYRVKYAKELQQVVEKKAKAKKEGA